MPRNTARRIATAVIAAAAFALAACSSPTGPSQDSPDGGTYGGSSTMTKQLCGGTYGGSSTC